VILRRQRFILKQRSCLWYREGGLVNDSLREDSRACKEERQPSALSKSRVHRPRRGAPCHGEDEVTRSHLRSRGTRTRTTC